MWFNSITPKESLEYKLCFCSHFIDMFIDFFILSGRSWSLVKNKVKKDYPTVQSTSWKVFYALLSNDTSLSRVVSENVLNYEDYLFQLLILCSFGRL